MAILLPQPEVTVEIAPPSFWGVPTQNKFGGVYEVPPRRFRGVSTGEIVEFAPWQVDVGDEKEIFFVQNARQWLDDTQPRIGGGNYRVVYPPFFRGTAAILLMPEDFISTFSPVLVSFVLPTHQPNGAPNKLSITIVDFGVEFVLAPTTDGKLQPLVQVGSTSQPLSDPIEVERAQWGSFVGTLYFFHTAIRHKERVLPVLYWKLGGTETIKPLLGYNLSINPAPTGQIYLRGYGAFRLSICGYNNGEGLALYPPLQAPFLATPAFLTVEDVYGTLHWQTGGVIPQNPNEFHPKVLRKVVVFHRPPLSTSGEWARLPNVTSLSWDTEGGSLEGYDLSVGRGAALRITVGSAQFLYRVTSVTRERSGDSQRERVHISFKTPLLGTEHTIPTRLNPYLLRIRDLIKAMQCSVHLNFSVSFPENLLDTVIYTDEEKEFNSVEDWADFLADQICAEDKFFGWYIVGNTIVFQSAAEPVTLPPVPTELITSQSTEISEDTATVGVVGRVTYFSPDLSQQGYVFKTGSVPTKRKERLTVKGLLLLPEGCFVRLPSNEVAKVSQVKWTVTPDKAGETEIQWEVLWL